jgi:predicted RNA-binding protein YlxR (DUF448 family)
VPQAELVRVAVVDGRAVADPRRRLPGRGAYLHARPACVAGAARGLARSFKRPVGKPELDGLRRALLADGATSARADAATNVADGPATGGEGAPGAAGDPGIMTPGQPVTKAVEIGSPSSTRTMSTPRPTSLPNATSSITSSGSAERSRPNKGQHQRF